MRQMVGTDVGTYTFVAATKTVTLLGLNPLNLEQILLISNVNTNQIIYQFNKVGYGATIAANILTLDFNTAAMSNSDNLQIFIDYQAPTITTTITGTIDENLVQVNGATVNVGTGVAGAGTQRVAVSSDSSLTANIGTTGGLALDVTLTNKTQFTKITDGTDTALVTAAGEVNVLATAQPGVDIGDVTVNNAGGAAAVNIQDGGNSITVDGVFFQATQPVSIAATVVISAASLPLPTGAATSALQTTGNTSLASIDTKLTSPLTVAGNKTNNNTAPGATNVGALSAIANAVSPAWTEGNQVAESVDLSGRQRVRGASTHNNAAPTSDLQGVLPALANAAAPTYTEGDLVLMSTLLNGALRTDNTSWFGSTAPTVGQKTMANSIPVVIASDQSVTITTTPATSATATLTNVTASTVNATLVAANAIRKGLGIYNDAGRNIYIKFGATASITSFTLRMADNTYYEMPQPIYTGVIDVITNAGSGSARVTELT